MSRMILTSKDKLILGEGWRNQFWNESKVKSLIVETKERKEGSKSEVLTMTEKMVE